MLIRTIRIRIMRTLTFLLTLLMATALQAQPLLDEASSTLQPALQQLGRRLLRHKTGSIVAIQPATGRVLCLVTHSPEGEKPALALATPYPPASTMKTAEALMLYSEGLIDDETPWPAMEPCARATSASTAIPTPRRCASPTPWPIPATRGF